MRNVLLLSIAVLMGVAPAGRADVRYVEPNAATGSCAAVVVPAELALVHTAQLLPLDADRRIVGKGRAAEQIRHVLDQLSRLLKDHGSDLDRLVKVNVCVAGQEVVPEVEKRFTRAFAGPAKPAVSVVVGRLAHGDALVAMDAVAVQRLEYTGPAQKPARAAASLSWRRSALVAAVLRSGRHAVFAEQGAGEAGGLHSAAHSKAALLDLIDRAELILMRQGKIVTGKGTVPINASLHLAPEAAVKAQGALRFYLEWETHKRALPNNAAWYALYRGGLIDAQTPESAKRAAALSFLGFIPVSPDESAYVYDKRRGEVASERHGSLRRPRLHSSIAETSPLNGLLAQFPNLRVDMRFREDGMHAVVTIARKR